MGMYDHLKIDCKWILGDNMFIHDIEFSYQTKSFDCNMNGYIVDNNGELWMMPRGASGHTYPYSYTGEIRFYDDDHEFVAWCVDGVVKEVVYVGGV